LYENLSDRINRGRRGKKENRKGKKIMFLPNNTGAYPKKIVVPVGSSNEMTKASANLAINI